MFQKRLWGMKADRRKNVGVEEGSEHFRHRLEKQVREALPTVLRFGPTCRQRKSSKKKSRIIEIIINLIQMIINANNHLKRNGSNGIIVTAQSGTKQMTQNPGSKESFELCIAGGKPS